MTFAYAFSLWFQTVAGTCWWRRSMRPGLRYRATLEGAAHLPLCWMALMSRRRCRESDDGPACRKPCAVSFKDWICKTLEASEIALLYAPKVSPWNNFSPEPFARWNKNFKTKLRSSLLIESSKTQSSKHLVFVGIPISCWPTTTPQHLAREAEGRSTEDLVNARSSEGRRYISPWSKMAAALLMSCVIKHWWATTYHTATSTAALEWVGKRETQPFRAALDWGSKNRSGKCESHFSKMNPNTVLLAVQIVPPASQRNCKYSTMVRSHTRWERDLRFLSAHFSSCPSASLYLPRVMGLTWQALSRLWAGTCMVELISGTLLRPLSPSSVERFAEFPDLLSLCLPFGRWVLAKENALPELGDFEDLIGDVANFAWPSLLCCETEALFETFNSCAKLFLIMAWPDHLENLVGPNFSQTFRISTS